MSTSSSSSASPGQVLNVLNSVTVKLNSHTNYDLWKSQFISFLKHNNLHSYIDGSSKCPPPTVYDHCRGISIPNEKFYAWSSLNDRVLSWINATLSERVSSLVVAGLSSAAEAWIAIERMMLLSQKPNYRGNTNCRKSIPSLPLKSVDVVGSKYCSTSIVDLIITRKDGGIVLYKKRDGKKIFEIIGDNKAISCHDRRSLVDDKGNRILSMQNKIKSLHKRWEAFKGDGKEILFTAKASELFQSSLCTQKSTDVFLANNTNKKVCDFKIKDRVVYTGDSDRIIAQMHESRTVGEESTLLLNVHPNIDQAFVVALLIPLIVR